MNNQRKTLNDLLLMKQAAEKISCLTAYDATFAGFMQAAGIDLVLVGDSLGMVVQGHETTLPVSMQEMLYHTQAVKRGACDTLVMVDLPFMSYATSVQAAENAAMLIKQGGAHIIKLEGAKLEVIEFMVAQGIPVCGHLGLLPQAIYQQGKYSVQGRSEQSAATILRQALAVEKAGAQLLILECVPAALAADISQQLTIPVIGIGAGSACDGQVLVCYDMLGLNSGYSPKFINNYLLQENSIFEAFKAYHDEVKSGDFPSLAESF